MTATIRMVLVAALVAFGLSPTGCGSANPTVDSAMFTDAAPLESSIDVSIPDVERTDVLVERPPVDVDEHVASDFVELVAGKDYTCARTAVGSVHCWGRNDLGQLGLGDAPDDECPGEPSRCRRRPARVVLPGPADGIAAGEDHACARMHDGTVLCWGSNDAGQIGDGYRGFEMCEIGATLSVPCRRTPFLVPGLRDVAEIGAGKYHTCARLRGGAVRCWGGGAVGVAGTGELCGGLLCVRTPTELPGLSAQRLYVGGNNSCALRVSGDLVCWGSSQFCQLGFGDTNENRYAEPTLHPSLQSATDLALGFSHSCARLADATALCFGNNMTGQIGDGTPTRRCTPTSPMDLTLVDQIAVGGAFTCARSNDGAVRCWGANNFGEAGADSRNAIGTPLEYLALRGARSLALGWYHACALMSGARIVCWGNNSVGSLGDGGLNNSVRGEPVDVRFF